MGQGDDVDRDPEREQRVLEPEHGVGDGGRGRGRHERHVRRNVPISDDREAGGHGEPRRGTDRAHPDPLVRLGPVRCQDEENRQRNPVAVDTEINDVVCAHGGPEGPAPSKRVPQNRGAEIHVGPHRVRRLARARDRVRTLERPLDQRDE